MEVGVQTIVSRVLLLDLNEGLEGIEMRLRGVMSVLVGAALLIGAGSAVAAPTVINFETLSAGTYVDNQFLSQGADFFGDAKVLSKSAGMLNAAYFPPYSGDKVIYDRDGKIRIDAVGDLWISAGAYVTGACDVILTAYDMSWNVIGTSSIGGANYVGAPSGIAPNALLSVSGPGIAHLVFQRTQDYRGYTLDDLTFEVAGVITNPAPGAVLLGSLGVGLVGWLRRRRMV